MVNQANLILGQLGPAALRRVLDQPRHAVSPGVVTHNGPVDFGWLQVDQGIGGRNATAARQAMPPDQRRLCPASGDVVVKVEPTDGQLCHCGIVRAKSPYDETAAPAKTAARPATPFIARWHRLQQWFQQPT